MPVFRSWLKIELFARSNYSTLWLMNANIVLHWLLRDSFVYTITCPRSPWTPCHDEVNSSVIIIIIIIIVVVVVVVAVVINHRHFIPPNYSVQYTQLSHHCFLESSTWICRLCCSLLSGRSLLVVVIRNSDVCVIVVIVLRTMYDIHVHVATDRWLE